MALTALVLTLVASTIFNATIRENATELGALFGGVLAPAVGVVGGLSRLPAPRLAALDATTRLAKPLAVLGLTALIYAGLDPDVGFDTRSLALVISLVAAIGVITAVYEGGQLLLSQRRYGAPAALRFHPLAIAVAGASVVLSRLIELHPGVIFGFVASVAVMAEGSLSRRQSGILVYLPMVGLLVASLVAFLLIAPLRDLTEGETGWWRAIPETVAVAVFVGGAQSVLFSLIPLTFNEGERVWNWSRAAWLSLALPASFLFFHVVVNRGGDASVGASEMRTLVMICAGLVGVALAVWWLLRAHRSRRLAI
jgi:hypothetical protein